MRVRKLTGAALCVFVAVQAATSGQTRQSLTPGEPIRVTTDRVNVGVIVTDSHGNFVEGLRREDFHVFDNGVEQPLTDFLAVGEPANLLLLIESGPAVVFLGKNHARAADQLLTSISTDDRVAVATYSRSPELMLDFTPYKAEARLALEGLNFVGGFAELNLSSSLQTTIDWLSATPGKKTVVLLSTGVDTSPYANWEAIQTKLRTGEVRVLAVSLAGDFRKPAKVKKVSPQEASNRAYVKHVFVEADQAIRAISQATGGRAYFPQNAKELERAYAEIAQLIRHEYSLAFAPPLRDGQVHSIAVKVRKSSYRTDHRQAYLAPTP
jgi:Ca-activated chloride channel family protein